MDESRPPFLRVGPELPASPVILSVPHAGRAYSDDLLRASRLPRHKLEILEDRLVDRLVWRAVEAGSAAFIATAPRAEIDLNRDEREIDPAMVYPSPAPATLLQSPRTRGGLGLVPARISGAGSIWLQRIGQAEIERRTAEIHRPYHAALAQALDAARARFGIAILLDCHSMPPRAGEEAAIVFGDRHGTSIAAELVAAAVAAAEVEGFATARNTPYAGGYITMRHGRPGEGVHALQIEIDRSLYLDAALRAPGAGFDRTSRVIAAVAAALAAKALEPPQAIAAE
ncbi:N-formylglutamate amidohydrolase [Sphingosinicella sp. LY1275]|uniref:N-formylglutamate amidohydrolase n=1 Tax=Sphingosinicella sp. LY1275 TaxID=3095379 RepID=UPI002ADEE3B3|nr:N-formylglutamate amidohydrolase [Sphingosinicella sp. LY1275]MEA1014772.1 N-formylglutamate amidohydrolase [Sphingosinicella sp. LY1275]